MKTVNFCFINPDTQLPKATLPLVEGSLKHGEVVGRYKGYTFVLYKVNPALPDENDGNIAINYITSYIRSNKIIPLFRELVNGKACYSIGTVFSRSMESFIQLMLSYTFPENSENLSNVVVAEPLKVSPKKVIGKIDGKKLVVGGKLSDTKKDELRLMRLNATNPNDEEGESYVFTDLIGIEELLDANITTVDDLNAHDLAAEKENTLINNIEAVSVYFTSNPY